MSSMLDGSEGFSVGGDGVEDLAALIDVNKAVLFAMDDHDGHGEMDGVVAGADLGGPHAGAAPSSAFDREGIDGGEWPEAGVESFGGVADRAIEAGKGGGAGDGRPAFGMAGGGLEGDGAALGDAEKEGGLIREAEGDLGVFVDGLNELGLVFSEGGDGRRVVTMAGEIDEDAAEAGGAKSFADWEVIFFPAGVTVEEDDGASDFAPCGEGDAAVGEAGAKLAGFVGLAGGIGGQDHQAGGGGCAGEGGDGKTVADGLGEDFTVIVLKAATGW